MLRRVLLHRISRCLKSITMSVIFSNIHFNEEVNVATTLIDQCISRLFNENEWSGINRMKKWRDRGGMEPTSRTKEYKSLRECSFS